MIETPSTTTRSSAIAARRRRRYKSKTIVHHRFACAALFFLLVVAGCENARTRECPSLLDVKARLARDVRTYPDPKTPKETAQNWTDEASKLQSERDALERLVFHDERLAIWASKWRDTIPIQARLARRMADAVKASDWKTTAELQTEWDDRQKLLAGVGQDVEAYCTTK